MRNGVLGYILVCILLILSGVLSIAWIRSEDASFTAEREERRYQLVQQANRLDRATVESIASSAAAARQTAVKLRKEALTMTLYGGPALAGIIALITTLGKERR